ncbi:hypothetical protein HME7025_02507 [Aquirufa nivalisilvae]|uniref:NADP-dependent oxidoreductase domain-containing protein n=1 Tax=Aquirufa nivalisilvae TaxID=2516557 RepID=A0A2S2E012_9BACT|nr:aldo/keto reductase [Aquirufa nivalisilvae]AWL10347.1 hypothetical protein HME7025_02507 [Aquirufa nivalisilvae]
MKFVIGSVQFGINYGINNFCGIPSDAELRGILHKAISNKINIIDTAAAYGDAEFRLGQLSQGEFQFISKFPNVTRKENIYEHFLNSSKNLGTSLLYGYMAHNANVLIENPEYWHELVRLKLEKKVLKIGYSLYNPEQLDTLLSLGYVPDIVQFPYSLLDRKFETSFDKLKDLNTEIHVRSVFLQGLYFKNPSSLQGNLATLNAPLTQLNEISKLYSIPMASLALSFVHYQDNIDKVVIGVDSVKQLEENIAFISTNKNIHKAIHAIRNIKIINPELLNPSNW